MESSPVDHVGADAGQGQVDRPAGHRSDVMVAELHFVPGVPPVAIVTRPRGVDDLESCIDHALEDEVRGDLILDAGPDLVGVHERQSRPATVRPAAQQQPGFIVHDKRSLDVVMVGERLA